MDACFYSKIMELGFDEKFMRTWEYYFDYCAAGFKTCTLGNYQVNIYSTTHPSIHLVVGREGKFVSLTRIFIIKYLVNFPYSLLLLGDEFEFFFSF